MPATTKITKRKVKNQTNKVRNMLREHKKDKKYKTEICKTYSLAGRCPYNEKCRFAHGEAEMFEKEVDTRLYKKKICVAFEEEGFCPYGLRCHFKHEVESTSVVGHYLTLIEDYKSFQKPKRNLRLEVFKTINHVFLPETDTESPLASRKTSVETKELKVVSYSITATLSVKKARQGDSLEATDWTCINIF